MLRQKWADRFFDVAKVIGSWSKDPRTKVGAIAVGDGHRILAEGYNGLPRYVKDDENRMLPPDKYLWTVHAEANLIAHAANHGVKLQGCTVYTTLHPCAQCAALLVQAGVATVVYDSTGKSNMPKEQFTVASQIFKEAGVVCRGYAHGTETEEQTVS